MYNYKNLYRGRKEEGKRREGGKAGVAQTLHLFG